LHKYAEEFGSLTKIDKQFKTKLYESFLQQEVEALGQYFTPRRVIQSVIRMGGLDAPSFQYSGRRICDPFCGVGGFLLEVLNMNESMMNCYAPNRDGKIELPFIMHGFDKGFERDDERTIIMAKTNMLIYLAEELFTHPNCSKEFARIFNQTFKLFKDNLGTFGYIIHNEAEKYDLILSNPPYVTSGTSIIKEEIRNTAHTANEYPVNALGLESISIEWIVRSLKGGGRAFIIVPDGILGRADGKLRKHILSHCYLDAIVSLPDRTFFANFEHTYILAITKKHHHDDVQTHPVFTYLASNIGERLTSVKREEIDEDDLPEMERLFRIFAADKAGTRELLQKQSGRCKIWDIERFLKGSQWVVDRWWSKAERIAVGAEERTEAASKSEVEKLVKKFNELLADYDQYISADPLKEMPVREVSLGDKTLFHMFNGNRVIKKDTCNDETLVPVYSANVFEPMGYIEADDEANNIKDFSHPSILWGIDGNFEFNLMPANIPFATTDHCGTLMILESSILPEYVLYAMTHRRIEERFDRGYCASLTNMRKFSIKVPVRSGGTKFDIAAQEAVAVRFAGTQERRARLEEVKNRLDAIFGRYVNAFYL
jgi:type I restriction-modification system DNA methylase subunit